MSCKNYIVSFRNKELVSVYAHSKASSAETVSVASKVCLFWSDKLKVSNLIFSLPYYQYGNDYMCQFYSQSRSPFYVSFNPITRLPLCVSFSPLARPPLHVSFNPITRLYIYIEATVRFSERNKDMIKMRLGLLCVSVFFP